MCKTKGVLFIHVPKAAGMSITTALYNREVGHYKLRDYESYECTTFSVVRNPYDRLVSAYSFLMQGGISRYRGDRYISSYLQKNYKNFEDFVINYIANERYGEYIHFVPQVEFLKGSDGEIRIDYIAKLETLNDDLKKFKRKFGIDIESIHINGSKRDSYERYYTPKLKAVVYEKYKDDFELLGYEK
ncbi:sulfotransferase family 2 domain-containing protein [Pseudoalteromonas piscicida]|uniref:sulfotransferase family 2 domain-containing protein n=1 Tax=Pseudoalteromonas piscicida TaxID=43662 RepID=UPI0027E3C707|nr:sulfotransferase family 2 domain-containing protein [Pseudoalteromonas piscicida]